MAKYSHRVYLVEAVLNNAEPERTKESVKKNTSYFLLEHNFV